MPFRSSSRTCTTYAGFASRTSTRTNRPSRTTSCEPPLFPMLRLHHSNCTPSNALCYPIPTHQAFRAKESATSYTTSRPSKRSPSPLVRSSSQIWKAASLPHLKSLASSAEDAQYLVPGRPVTSLTLLTLPTHLMPEIWKAILRSRGPITHLNVALVMKFLNGDNLACLARHMSGVTHMEILDVPESNYEDVSWIYYFDCLTAGWLT